MCVCAWARCRALTRPEGRAFISQYGEPAKLCQDEPATTSSARFISTFDADIPPQKCIKEKRSGDFRLSSYENCGHSAILPMAKISTCLIAISSVRKSKDSSWSMPPTPQGRMTDREQAVHRLSHSADRPKHNIIGP